MRIRQVLAPQAQRPAVGLAGERNVGGKSGVEVLPHGVGVVPVHRTGAANACACRYVAEGRTNGQ